MKKLLFSLLFIILLLGSVSAFELNELNNKLTYENNDLKISLDNWWGLGTNYGTAEIKSHSSVQEVRNVSVGKDKVVMWYEFNFTDLYENGLGEVTFENVILKEYVERDYSFVYLGQKQRDVYGKTNCKNTFPNSTQYNCDWDVIGTENYEDWLPYDTANIPKGKITIGLMTDVYPVEIIDAVWTIAGKKVTRHISFTGLGEHSNDNVNLDNNPTDVKVKLKTLTNGVITELQLGNGDSSAFASNTSIWQNNVRLVFKEQAAWKFDTAPLVTFSLGDYSDTINSTVDSGTFYVLVNKSGGSNIGMKSSDSQFNGTLFEYASQNMLAKHSSQGARPIFTFNQTTSLTVDVVHPQAIVYTVQQTQLNYTHVGGSFCWNSVNGGVTNSTPPLVAGNNFTISPGSTLGSNTWIVWCNESSGGLIASDSVTFFDNRGVNVELLNPANQSNTTNQVVTFSYNSTPIGTNLVNTTLHIWYKNGTKLGTNFTTLSGSSEVQTNFTRFIPEGIFLFNAETFTNVPGGSNMSVENNTFTVHVTSPEIIILNPRGDQGVLSNGQTLILNWSISEPGENLTTHVINCTYTYNSALTILNNTACTVFNETTFNYVAGINNLSFTVTDIFNLQTTNTTEWTSTFTETAVAFNSTGVYETDNEQFTLSMLSSVDILTIDSFLNYNGTRERSDVNCVSGNCTIENEIDLPLVVSASEFENKTFFWEVTIFNGTNSFQVNTSTREQNVSKIHLEVCNATFTNQTLNFTAFDEGNLTNINPFTFDATFISWLGSGDITKETNFTNSSAASIQLCIDPAEETFNINADIEYNKAGSTSYTTRNYFFQNDTVNNISQDIGLGLLLTTDSTTYILLAQDDNVLPVSNVLIYSQRFYPGLNEFRTVQVGKTDDNGKTSGFFKTETVDYRFLLRANGTDLLQTNSQKILQESTPFTLTFTIGEDAGAPWEPFEPLTGLSSTLLFNKTTNIVTFAYTDSNSSFELGRLLVQRQNASGVNQIICNSNSSQSSATILCDLSTNSTGQYSASGFITRNGREFLQNQLNFMIETFSSITGNLGLFLGFFIILISSFAFKFNEVAGIVLINLAIITVNTIGLIAFGPVFITAILALSIIIIVLLER